MGHLRTRIDQARHAVADFICACNHYHNRYTPLDTARVFLQALIHGY